MRTRTRTTRNRNRTHKNDKRHKRHKINRRRTKHKHIKRGNRNRNRTRKNYNGGSIKQFNMTVPYLPLGGPYIQGSNTNGLDGGYYFPLAEDLSAPNGIIQNR